MVVSKHGNDCSQNYVCQSLTNKICAGKIVNGMAISSFTSDKDSIYENKPAYNVKTSIAGDFVGGKGTSHKDFTI